MPETPEVSFREGPDTPSNAVQGNYACVLPVFLVGKGGVKPVIQVVKVAGLLQRPFELPDFPSDRGGANPILAIV